MGDKEQIKAAIELLETLRQKDVTSFVASLLEDDPAILHRFLQRFGPFDLMRAKSDLLFDLRQAEYDNTSYGNGYVDWYHTSSLASAIRQITGAHLDGVLARGAFESALDLSFETYVFLTQVDVDDSDGFTEDMLDVLDEVWDTIYDTARERSDDDLLRLLYDRLKAYTTDPDIQERTYSDSVGYDTYDYQCEHIESYLVDRFCVVSAYAPTILELADRELASAIECFRLREASGTRLGTSSSSRGYYTQGVTRWVLVRLRCMESMNVPYAERLAFAEEYLCEKPVCLHLAGERERAGEEGEALRIIETCLDRAREKGAETPDWALARAIGLHERAGNTQAVRSLLEQLVVCGARRADATEWFGKLRGMCDTAEWYVLRESVFSRVDDDRSRWRYYVEEGLFDRLMDEIEPDGAPALGEFERHLAQRFPERVLALYKTDLLEGDNGNPPVGSTRGRYASYASRVRHIRSIPGGDELADAIVARVLELFPRRPALRQELASA